MAGAVASGAAAAAASPLDAAADRPPHPHAHAGADAASAEAESAAHARTSSVIDARRRRMRYDLSVVIVSRDEGKNLRRTFRALRATMPLNREIVVIDDGSIDGSAEFIRPGPSVQLVRTKGLGVTKARNLGARHSRGDAVVFADAHIDVQPHWWLPLRRVLFRRGVGAVSPCITVMGKPQVRGYGLRLQAADLSTSLLARGDGRPRPVPIVPGCFLAMRRETFAATGGYDAGMDTWGMSDVEFSIRHWLLGHELWVVPEVEVAHLFRNRHPYKVRWRSVLHNTMRTAFVHFNRRRIRRVVDALRDFPEFAEALSRAATDKTRRRRRDVMDARRHTDDWYFRKFNLDAF